MILLFGDDGVALQVPVLETADGCICESNAIARYIGRMRRDTELYGVSFFETAQVSCTPLRHTP